MWRMQDDDRVLTEPEWALFRAGVDLLRDWIEEDIRHETDSEIGVAVFDRLTSEQKLALLAHTTVALRDPSVRSGFLAHHDVQEALSAHGRGKFDPDDPGAQIRAGCVVGGR
jgi:hypothetical protein